MAIKNFGMKEMHSFLLEKTYSVPTYQREFSWTADELEDFWLDLKNTVEEHRESHFLGQIVIHQESDASPCFLIDGQQRATTSVIFLAVIRDIMKQYGSHEEAEPIYADIQSIYIGRFSASRNDLRLKLGDSNNAFFRDHIQRRFDYVKEGSPSQKRIMYAYNYFKSEFDKLTNGMDDESRIMTVKLYYETFLHKFNVMSITTDEVNEAFIIFETLNARGKDLETADLLKNYVMMQAKNQVDAIQEKWSHMIENLVKRDDATRFIRYHWNSSNGFMQERSLYKTITQAIDSRNCLSFVDALDKSTDLYNAMIEPADNTYFSDKRLKNVLINLSILGASTFYPIVFAMNSRRYNDEDILRVLQAIETLVVRNFVVGRQPSKQFEQSFASLARRISKNSIPVTEILEDIISGTSDDAKFQRDLIGVTVKTAPVAKYMLREIEDLNSCEKITNKDNFVINLEHIMPKNPSKWSVSDSFHKENLYRLANQALLLEEYNKSISNSDFAKKKEMYAKSAITTTKMLCKYDSWTEKEMNERERYLIDQILQRWPIAR